MDRAGHGGALARETRSGAGAGGPRDNVVRARAPTAEVMGIFLRKPGFLLSRVDQIANAVYGHASAGGETLAQAEMLLAIAAGASSDQVGLARACGVDTSTTGVIVDNLQQAGLVTRIQDRQDRRRSLPTLTQAGRARMPGVASAFARLQEDLLSGLDAPDRARLTDLLVRLARAQGEALAPRWDAGTSPFARAPSLLFRRALQISHAQFAACVAPLTITLRQFSALVILHLHPGLSQVEYARIYGLDPSTCAIVLKKLAARDLLAAERCTQDRRKTLYATTAAGAEQVAAIQPVADRSERIMFAAVPADDVAWLLDMLRHIARRHSNLLRFPGSLPWGD